MNKDAIASSTRNRLLSKSSGIPLRPVQRPPKSRCEAETGAWRSIWGGGTRLPVLIGPGCELDARSVPRRRSLCSPPLPLARLSSSPALFLSVADTPPPSKQPGDLCANSDYVGCCDDEYQVTGKSQWTKICLGRSKDAAGSWHPNVRLCAVQLALLGRSWRRLRVVLYCHATLPSAAPTGLSFLGDARRTHAITHTCVGLPETLHIPPPIRSFTILFPPCPSRPTSCLSSSAPVIPTSRQPSDPARK